MNNCVKLLWGNGEETIAYISEIVELDNKFYYLLDFNDRDDDKIYIVSLEYNEEFGKEVFVPVTDDEMFEIIKEEYFKLEE